eukprot:GILJ01023689.1.p2 GENE.GILJ01023689.1~~GILJ01023689.1.p2  ORF type:complete len:203 (+),score=25.52 GILJ01023689.1:1217-1825(+)
MQQDYKSNQSIQAWQPVPSSRVLPKLHRLIEKPEDTLLIHTLETLSTIDRCSCMSPELSAMLMRLFTEFQNECRQFVSTAMFDVSSNWSMFLNSFMTYIVNDERSTVPALTRWMREKLVGDDTIIKCLVSNKAEIEQKINLLAKLDQGLALQAGVYHLSPQLHNGIAVTLGSDLMINAKEMGIQLPHNMEGFVVQLNVAQHQ